VAYAVRLSRRLRTLAPDLVHTNTLKAALYGGLAGRMAGVPVIWHIRDRIAADYLPRPAVHAVRQLARILPSAVIVNSYATADTLRRAGRVTTLRGPVVHDPVAQRPQRGEEPDPAVVGIIGRLAPWKGQHVFLRAFALAFPNGEVTARIVGAPLFGEDDYLDQLHRLVDDLGLEGRVRFTGHVDDIWAELARMTVVVHASVVPEPFGQVVVEAMAAGRPVIATNVGGPAEVIRTGHTGLLVPPDDVSRLAAAMQRLTDDAALRRMLTENAERELTRFAPEPVRAAVYSVYERVRRPCPRDGGGLEPLGARHAPEEV
jgi:glycosyltransferase involved in cell wall biosynthesis